VPVIALFAAGESKVTLGAVVSIVKVLKVAPGCCRRSRSSTSPGA
jgi:hypothetical protein